MLETQYYGEFGGAYLPEILVSTFEDLAAAFREARNDAGFWEQYKNLMSTYSCRPTPLTFADNLTAYFGGPQIYIKREDLNHTGAHKANNVMGHAMLSGARLGDHPALAHSFDQHALPHYIVGLVRAGMIQILAFDVNLRAAEIGGQIVGERQRCRPT